MGSAGGVLFPDTIKKGYRRRNFETHFTTAPRRNIRSEYQMLARTQTDNPERDLETTSKNDFTQPEKEEKRPKANLVRIDTFKHTKNPRPTDTAQEGSMWATHPRHTDDHGMRYFDTTTQTELDNGLKMREDLVLPRVGEGQGPDVCRGGHEKAHTNFHVFPFGHAKNNFYSTPGNRNNFRRESSMISRGAAPSPSAEMESDEPKRFGRRYAFTGMARRAGARVFYDENVQ